MNLSSSFSIFSKISFLSNISLFSNKQAIFFMISTIKNEFAEIDVFYSDSQNHNTKIECQIPWKFTFTSISDVVGEVFWEL